MGFTTELDVREHSSRDWELLSDLVYKGARDTFTVPAGFRTDFASVPRLFWPILGPTGRYTKAAVLHDWCYVEAPATHPGGRYWRSPESRAMTRQEADRIFYRAMSELGVSWWARKTMYWAVRSFGASCWERARKKQAARAN